jgi:hypothetical protein
MPVRYDPRLLVVSIFSSVGQPSPAGSHVVSCDLRATDAPERILCHARGPAQSLVGRASHAG